MVDNRLQFLAFIILTIGILSLYCSMFVPSTLEEQILKHYNIDSYRFGLLASILSWTSLLDVFHGYLLDRYINILPATIIYSIFYVTGAIMMTVSGYTKQYWLLMLGRVIFGLGSNPIMLTTNLHIIHWFSQGKYINLTYTFSESVIMLGSSVVFFISLQLFDLFQQTYGTSDAFQLTFALELSVFCCLAVISALSLSYIHKYKQSPLSRNHTKTSDKQLSIKDYVVFPPIFWMFSLAIFLYYVSFGTFLNMSQAFFTNKFSMTAGHANTLAGFVTLVAFIFSSPYGIFLDKFGLNLIFLTIAVILQILALGLFTFTAFTPVVSVIFIGFSITFSTSMWSLFQYLVAEHQCMIAYGMAQTGSNASGAIGNIFAGIIIQNFGYYGFTLFLFITVLCAIPCLAIVWYLNLRKGNFLNLSPQKRNIYLGRFADPL